MTNKKKRFKLAREFRKLGIPFKTARKMANHWLRWHYFDDMPGELEVVRYKSECRNTFESFLFVITPKGGFDLMFTDIWASENRIYKPKSS